MIPLGWRDLARLLAAFLLWSAVGLVLFPAYEEPLLWATEAALRLIRPHGLAVVLGAAYPSLTWSFTDPAQGTQSGALSFTILVYNSVLYLAILTAWPGLSLKGRLLFAATAVPMIFCFHVLDLGLTVESRVLSVLQAGHYDFRRDFGLWFSVVKYYNFFSIMALKQIVFLALFGVQYRWLPCWVPSVRVKSGSL